MNKISVIPEPLKTENKEGCFFLSKNTSIVLPGAVLSLKEDILFCFKKYLKIIPVFTESENALVFSIDENLEKGHYFLEMGPEKTLIRASGEEGLRYGLKSFIMAASQFINPLTSKAEIPCADIEDRPSFSWRGVMMDSARHMQSVAWIKKFIDTVSLYKINYMQWHLTDDQGWRVEMKKYPALHEKASIRKRTLVGHVDEEPLQYDNEEYGGYYSRDEIKEIVKYASSRGITIVPEYDLPGHSQAVLSVFPEYGCTGEKTEVRQKWGISKDILNPFPDTINFAKDILAEFMELFPSQYIHIGGDEAIKDRWINSPRIQEYKKELGLADEKQLQSHFISEIFDFLKENGKEVMAWDEVIEAGFEKDIITFSWRGDEGGAASAKSKRRAVMANKEFNYLDKFQEKQEDEPLSINGPVTLEQTYSYCPFPDGLSESEKEFILGVQANIWTEYIDSESHFEYMAFPRLLAMAENGWCKQERKDFSRFKKSWEIQKKLMRIAGINFYGK
ncbi:MAG: beta-N-acetylhexosaminidase [Fibrobacterota bacterium]